MKYKEYKNLDLSKIGKDILKYWEENNIFEKSLKINDDNKPFVFYEGPPSANGKPGIHHVMARSIKDIFCRYKTLKGFNVQRKAGWDTHGLPVEIGVEKSLNITKEDIGKKISIEEYNNACRTEVMKYKNLWEDLTNKMGYWIDMDDPYITFDNKYIETLWYLLEKLYDKGLIYKGYTIQPYSPAAGTGLSQHELSQPGCYRNVKDNTLVAQFKIERNEKSEFLFKDVDTDLYFIAWTTTPWTLPSNTALAVGKNIEYVKIKTINKYTSLPITVILGKNSVEKYFPVKVSKKSKDNNLAISVSHTIMDTYKGSDLKDVRYEQLMPYAQPKDGDAFKVIIGNFVTTDEGTGIVHIAPSFGADDFLVGKQNGMGSLTLVNKKGQFTDEMGEFAGRYVKSEFAPDHDAKNPNNVDIDIIVKLKKENRAFKTEKYEHSYPHCWRTDKPILYYPLDSWFIKTTQYKDKMIELNKTINWKPISTGVGRFGNWLENLVDWNLSRSRFWGTPLPIWLSKDRKEKVFIGSIEQLKKEIEKSVKAGFMEKNPLQDFVPGDNSKENYGNFDLHRPYVDNIILCSASGKKMFREPDLIDVWFDSGSMPYAQLHYPFENKEKLKDSFPCDFIAEGVDQTRGWFFTMHAIAVMLFDKICYKTCISNGLVLDKKGNKMSKRLGNAVDPFETIEKYGADPTRWYMITNSQPWDNLKFNVQGIDEVRRKFFGTLYNTYNFFALYANIDKFNYSEEEIPVEKRPEIDRWIISELNTLIKNVDEFYNNYEPTKAGRAIQKFLDEHLSNWYVRLCRRRFWKGDYSEDKISAYQTLYKCLMTIAHLSSPIAPFFMENLYKDLNSITNKISAESIHLSSFPKVEISLIDKALEERMQLAQQISSMVLSLRKKTNIRVRQPLNKIMLAVIDENFEEQVEKVKQLILSEVNVKNIEYINDTSNILVKKIKANFKTLGPKYGKLMKQISAEIMTFDQEKIHQIEKEGKYTIIINEENIELSINDVEIISEDIPGWLVTNMGKLTVALDITISEELKQQGYARELINRIQNIRKNKGFDVTDKITVRIEKHNDIIAMINNNFSYICSETLTTNFKMVDSIDCQEKESIDLSEDIFTNILIEKTI